MAKRRGEPKRTEETFSITAGSLGPVGPCEVQVKPLTVLVGRQGTGKSLLAQMLYFFRGLPPLVRFDLAARRLKENESEPRKIVRRLVDGLRSSHRSFARMTVPSVALRWRGNLAVDGVVGSPHDLKLNIQSKTSQVVPGKPLVKLVEAVRDSASEPPLTAVFVPTERLLYAMQLGPNALRVIGAPLLLETFAQMMEVAGRVQSDWDGGHPDTPQGRWVRERLLQALAGEARMRGTSWRWAFASSGQKRQIDFDMASSGQRANWPLSMIPQVLFSLRSQGELANDFTLYVEEPEIHLHPAAERAVVETLAYLVNQGMRVVLTTHSLTVLYTINNLLLAGDLSVSENAKDVPDQAIRLRARDVAAYHLRPDGKVDDLLDGSDTVDERALASVADDLSMEMNRILRRKGPPA